MAQEACRLQIPRRQRCPAAPQLHVDEMDRTHLDLWTDSEAEQVAEVERLEKLGATRVDWRYPEDADFVVGNHKERTRGATAFRSIDELADLEAEQSIFGSETPSLRIPRQGLQLFGELSKPTLSGVRRTLDEIIDCLV